MFCLCRPVLIDNIAQVCWIWRYLIPGSAPHLGSLPRLYVWYASCRHVGGFSTPSDPLVIDYVDKHHDITAEYEESMILALRHRERVRRVYLLVPVRNSQKVVAAIDKEFLALDYLYIGPPTGHNTTLRLLKT